MKATGLVILESLDSDSCLESLHIIRSEEWKVDSAVPPQPGIWHGLFFEVEDGSADAISRSIASCMKGGPWYADMRSSGERIVIFRDRVFRWGRGDSRTKAAAAEYGRAAGIPASQLDWGD